MTEAYDKVSPKSFRMPDVVIDDVAGEDAYESPASPMTYTRISWIDELHGEKNPKWRFQIANQLPASTHMVASRKVITCDPGHFEYTWNTRPDHKPIGRHKVTFQGSFGFSPSIAVNAFGVPAGTADNDATGRWYSNVRNAVSQFKGSTFAAESNEARRMMHDRANKMLTKIPIFQTLLRKRWLKSRTKRGKLKTLSNSWLELKFGWLPLASDIQDGYKALLDPRPMFLTVGASADNKAEDPNYRASGAMTVGAANIQYEQKATTTYSVRYKGMVRVREQPTADALLDFGVGVREFLPTLWEVIPWSFAIDYFTNVGQIINAISYATVETRWSCKTVRQTRIVTCSGSGFGSSGLNLSESSTHINVPSSVKVEATSIGRFPEPYIGIPGLTFHLPSVGQTLNLAALAVSRRLRLAY